MRRLRFIALACFTAISSGALKAQQPFYTDDPSVTDAGNWHFEAFNEFDSLQRPQFPNLRQNTFSYRLNYGLPHNLEIDLDAPYLSIFRAVEGSPATSNGIGDTNMGVKWNFHKHASESWVPEMSATLYFEFPTGDSRQQLGSGLTDYWLNLIGQKRIGEKTRINGNAGVLFAGNTSVGALGIQTRRGRVYTGGISMLHDFNDRWTFGLELVAGITGNLDLSKSQLQFLAGGNYAIRKGLTFDFGVLGGKYIASPRIGGQVGFSVDFPSATK